VEQLVLAIMAASDPRQRPSWPWVVRAWGLIMTVRAAMEGGAANKVGVTGASAVLL